MLTPNAACIQLSTHASALKSGFKNKFISLYSIEFAAPLSSNAIFARIAFQNWIHTQCTKRSNIKNLFPVFFYHQHHRHHHRIFIKYLYVAMILRVQFAASSSARLISLIRLRRDNPEHQQSSCRVLSPGFTCGALSRFAFARIENPFCGETRIWGRWVIQIRAALISQNSNINSRKIKSYYSAGQVTNIQLRTTN